MSAYSKIATLGLLSALALTGSLIAGTDAFAGKEKFKRSKPHVNVGTSSTNDQMQIQTGNPTGNQGPGGPRTGSDRIDLSVCDLATFDHKKCLGG